MRCHVIFVGVLLLLCKAGISDALSLPEVENNHVDLLEIILKEYDSRFSISSIWQNIKDSLQNAWNSIQSSVKETLEKIKIWIYELRLKTEELIEKVKQRLTQLNEEIKKKLDEIAKQSEEMAKIVKRCYESHKEDIDKILNDSLEEIRQCIFDSSRAISDFERSLSKSIITDTEFVENIKSKLDSCANGDENIDQCLLNVKYDLYNEAKSTERGIFKKEDDTKGIIDDIMDKLLTCTTKGVTKASEKLSKKVVDIGKCIQNEINNKDNEITYIHLGQKLQ